MCVRVHAVEAECEVRSSRQSEAASSRQVVVAGMKPQTTTPHDDARVGGGGGDDDVGVRVYVELENHRDGGVGGGVARCRRGVIDSDSSLDSLTTRRRWLSMTAMTMGDGHDSRRHAMSARDGCEIVLVATSRDRGETYLDAQAARAAAVDDETPGAGAVSARRVFNATRRRDRVREMKKCGGLLTRATLNALQKKHGAPSTSWGQFLRSKQRAMQRLPPGTASMIRLASTRNLRLEQERVSFSHPVRSIGRKRALLIGINYECFDGDDGEANKRDKWRAQRRGGDATRMRDYLKTHCGYDEDDDVRVLVDDSDVDSKAGPVSRSCGKKDILDACRWLVAGARDGDSLFFYFSGRDVEGGEQRKQKNAPRGLEKTALCAADTPIDQDANRITRRELREALVNPLPRGVRLTLFLDMLGGGGEHAVGDLPYSCVQILLPDERDIKDAKSGKNVTPMTPLWMVPNGESVVKEYVACADAATAAYKTHAQKFENVQTRRDAIERMLRDVAVVSADADAKVDAPPMKDEVKMEAESAVAISDPIKVEKVPSLRTIPEERIESGEAAAPQPPAGAERQPSCGCVTM